MQKLLSFTIGDNLDAFPIGLIVDAMTYEGSPFSLERYQKDEVIFGGRTKSSSRILDLLLHSATQPFAITEVMMFTNMGNSLLIQVGDGDNQTLWYGGSYILPVMGIQENVNGGVLNLRKGESHIVYPVRRSTPQVGHIILPTKQVNIRFSNHWQARVLSE